MAEEKTMLRVKQSLTSSSSCHNFQDDNNKIYCDGSIENPFPNILEALEYAAGKNEFLQTASHIVIMITASNNSITDLDVERIIKRRITKSN